jgi:hypothetical protein
MRALRVIIIRVGFIRLGFIGFDFSLIFKYRIYLLRTLLFSVGFVTMAINEFVLIRMCQCA